MVKVHLANTELIEKHFYTKQRIGKYQISKYMGAKLPAPPCHAHDQSITTRRGHVQKKYAWFIQKLSGLNACSALFKVLWVTETASQIFPTVSQNTVEPFCITTTKIHQYLVLWLSRYSDEIVAASQNLKKPRGHQGQIFENRAHVSVQFKQQLFIGVSRSHLNTLYARIQFISANRQYVLYHLQICCCHHPIF